MQVALNKFLIVISVICQGCSLHFAGDDGRDYHLGFLILESQKTKTTTLTTIKSVGFTIDSTSDSGGFNLGVRSISKTTFRPDSTTTIDGDAFGRLGLADVKFFGTSVVGSSVNSCDSNQCSDYICDSSAIK